MPSASTTSAARIRPRTAPWRGKRLPEELRPIMPPMVVAVALAGSGPKVRDSPARCASRLAATTPGCTRTDSSSVARIRRMDREQSMTTPGPRLPPQTLDPPPRACTGTPRSAAQATVAATSSADRGRTTTSGRAANRLASVA